MSTEKTSKDTGLSFIEDGIYKAKAQHSKSAIFIWIAYGIYAVFTNKLNGLITLAVYFSVGLFIASYASIVTYLLKSSLAKLFSKIQSPDTVVVLFSYILFPIEIIWVVFVATLFLRLINNI